MKKRLSPEDMKKMKRIAEIQKNRKEAMNEINFILAKYNLKLVVNHTVELREKK